MRTMGISKSQLFVLAFVLGLMGGSFLVDLILMEENAMMMLDVHSMIRGDLLPPRLIMLAAESSGSEHSQDVSSSSPSKPASLFRPFLSSPELHNTTVSGESIPGLFHHDKLFLFGARLTTSFQPDDQKVHVDLFGFPGDWFTRKRRPADQNPACVGTKDPSNGRMMTYAEVQHNVTMYCMIECQDNNNQKCQQQQKAIPMSFVPLVSSDPNQSETTLIWRCNISHLVEKSMLVQESQLVEERALRVKFMISHNNNKNHHRHDHVATVDIPLSTAVVGHAGPQIRAGHGAGRYFLQPTPLKVGLTTAIFGNTRSSDPWRAIHYLREFVQHHLNAGFQQIVIGIETRLDSDIIHRTKQMLSSYIDQGTVLLAATDAQSFLGDCDEGDYAKLHFFHSALYHWKGVAPYSATWDIDEFWVPPTVVKRKSVDSDESFLPAIQNDKLWQESNYKSSYSIGRVIDMINAYYYESSNNNNDCKNHPDWCFHMFPSYTLHVREDRQQPEGINRSNQHVFDFVQRDEFPNTVWQKSITNTQIAHMGGMHMQGSCVYDESDKDATTMYHENSMNPECSSIQQQKPTTNFGSIHHAFELLTSRTYPLTDHVGTKPDDEYVKLYAVTVAQQLNAAVKEKK